MGKGFMLCMVLVGVVAAPGWTEALRHIPQEVRIPNHQEFPYPSYPIADIAKTVLDAASNLVGG